MIVLENSSGPKYHPGSDRTYRILRRTLTTRQLFGPLLGRGGQEFLDSFAEEASCCPLVLTRDILPALSEFAPAKVYNLLSDWKSSLREKKNNPENFIFLFLFFNGERIVREHAPPGERTLLETSEGTLRK